MSSTLRRKFLKGMTFLGAAGMFPTVANAQINAKGTPMSDELTAEEIVRLLELQPNATCGFVRVTFLSKESIAPGGVPAPFANGRPLGSALYFLVTPDAPVRLHRIRNDQLYHHYLGAPLEVLLLHGDGTSEVRTVGSDLRAGVRPQLLIPGGTFHTSRLPEGGWALLASTEWPGVEPADVEQGDPAELARSHPDAAGWLRSLSEAPAS
jgi:predicted cupin superfamily sugar epimerase